MQRKKPSLRLDMLYQQEVEHDEQKAPLDDNATATNSAIRSESRFKSILKKLNN